MTSDNSHMTAQGLRFDASLRTFRVRRCPQDSAPTGSATSEGAPIPPAQGSDLTNLAVTAEGSGNETAENESSATAEAPSARALLSTSAPGEGVRGIVLADSSTMVDENAPLLTPILMHVISNEEGCTFASWKDLATDSDVSGRGNDAWKDAQINTICADFSSVCVPSVKTRDAQVVLRLGQISVSTVPVEHWADAGSGEGSRKITQTFIDSLPGYRETSNEGSLALLLKCSPSDVCTVKWRASDSGDAERCELVVADVAFPDGSSGVRSRIDKNGNLVAGALEVLIPITSESATSADSYMHFAVRRKPDVVSENVVSKHEAKDSDIWNSVPTDAASLDRKDARGDLAEQDEGDGEERRTEAAHEGVDLERGAELGENLTEAPDPIEMAGLIEKGDRGSLAEQHNPGSTSRPSGMAKEPVNSDPTAESADESADIDARIHGERVKGVGEEAPPVQYDEAECADDWVKV